MKNTIKSLIWIWILAFILLSCGVNYYKPGVMPAGKSELTRKQIKRDFTN